MMKTDSVLPALDLLTVKELQSLRSALLKESVDARKQANKLMVKNPALTLLWTKSMSSNISAEERAVTEDSLHLALLKQPAAFIQYQHANTMVSLAHCVWQEILRRSL